MTEPKLEFAFGVEIEFPPGERLRFEPACMEFTRGFVPVVGGSVNGPRLNGRVVPHSGGDWPRFWRSGLVEFEAHYLLEADDGTPIYVHNAGLAYASPETLAKIERGEQLEQPHYCRTSPRLEAPDGPHGWLARTMFVVTAERRGDRTNFKYYAVT